jgi:signal transduction histidine kinase
MPEKRRSIRRRLSLGSAGLAVALTGLAIAAVVWTTELVLRQQVDDQLEQELSDLETRHAERGWQELAAEVGRRGEAKVPYFYVFTEARYEQRIAGDLPGWPEGVGAQETGRTIEWRLRAVQREIRVASSTLEDGRHLLVARDFSVHRDLKEVLGMAGLVTFAGAVLLAIAGGLAIGRYLLGRVEGMNSTILRILAGARRERVPIGEREDEFDALASHFNRLLDENEQLVQRVWDVSDDIAHDLRTPLTRMRGHIESALAAPRDAGRAADALHRLLADTNGVLDTFNALLQIAQIESGTIREEMEPLELGLLVRGAVELYQPVAEEAGLRLEADLAEGVEVMGNRHLLAQAITNLIDNAIKYGAGGKAVSVTTRPGPAAELIVSDRGAGIPAQERERVLQRFVRLDAARAAPGTGLGLSFVAAVAELHGARLRLDDAAPGLRVTLAFPAAV